jgi:hypothetical protein
MQIKCKQAAELGMRIFGALPQQLSPSVAKRDLVPRLLTLQIGDQTLYFDSIPERVIGQLLLRYGLVSSLSEGENLHVITNDKRASIDFLVEGVFIEFHPLSHGDRKRGLTLEQSHERKFDNIERPHLLGHDICFLEKLSDFYTLITTHPNLKPILNRTRPGLSRADFLKDVRELRHSGEQQSDETGNRSFNLHRFLD